MQDKLETPHFNSEAEEAEWWDQQESALADVLEAATASGTLSSGTAARRAKTPTTTIRLDPADIARARSQAEHCGLRYQTYLKMLIHQELQNREASRTGTELSNVNTQKIQRRPGRHVTRASTGG